MCVSMYVCESVIMYVCEYVYLPRIRINLLATPPWPAGIKKLMSDHGVVLYVCV